MSETFPPECPNAATHGNPFRYCPCGWSEGESLTLAEKVSEGYPLTGAEQLEYCFQTMRKLEKLVDSLGPQLEALTSGPMAGMLQMFGIGK